MLVAYDTETNHLKDTESATSIKAMRQSAKNIMYTVVNSRAYEGNNAKGGLMSWQILAIGIDVILAAGLVYLELFMWKRYKAKRESEVTEEAVLEGKNDEA